MDSPDSEWIERELIVFLSRVRPWVLFIGVTILLVAGAGLLQTVYWGFVGDQFLLPLVLFAILGAPGVFLVLAAKKASEALVNRRAVKPTLRMFLGFAQIVGVLCGFQLIGLVLAVYNTVVGS